MKLFKVFCVFCLVLIASPAVAQDNNGATVIDEIDCVLSHLDSGLPVDLFTTDSHSVVNHAGNSVLKCYFQFDPVLCPSEKAIITTGFPCGTFLGAANKSRTTTDCTDGIAVLTCMVKHND